jgi:ubiquinone/menaquinone biosynthesis C-methylase UbiE
MYVNGTYLTNHPTWHIEDSLWKARHVVAMLERGKVQPRTICEIGCGAGAILSALQTLLPRECEFWGYDIAPQAIDLCRPKANDRLHFTLGSPLDNPNAHFDVVLLLDVVEHVDDYLSWLRALRPKATYKVLHLPLDLSVQAVLRPGRLLVERRLSGHLHYFTKETALATLADVDYEVLDYFYTAGTVDLRVKSLKSRLLKLPRRFLFALTQDWAVRLLGGYSLMVLAA